MKTWVEPERVAVSEALRAAVGGHPLTAETLARRGYTDPERALAFLDPARYTPASPYDLPDMARAVARVRRALERDEQVCVWGDFDVDGQTATALLISALETLGADVGYYVPLREGEGHGVHLTGLEHVIDGGAKLVVTCDTGISAHEAVAYARARGVDLVITDHHELPPALPDAAAAVNPRRLPPGHPLSHLPGVGVAYKLIEALDPAEAERHLDLAALGIVADLATQLDDTRYLLQRGLAALRRTERLGLRVMLDLAGLDAEGLTEGHIGFVLGPRLNAAGRLADARAGVELLTTDDPTRAGILARDLESLNARRRLMCDQVYAAAEAQIAADPRLLDDAALALSHPNWPAGVVGIVASRLVEQYNRPVVLLSSPPGEMARGSARSVDGVNITAAIAAQADLLAGFGGHPMAAGLSLPPENLAAFRRGLSRAVAAMRGATPGQPTLAIDAYVTLDALTPALAEELGRLAPFGPGNPPVVLAARDLKLTARRPVGRDGEHLLAEVEDAVGRTQRVIWWGGASAPLPPELLEGDEAFDLAFTVRASDFRGQPQVEVEWLDHRPAAGVEAAPRAPKSYGVIDYRDAADPEAALGALLAEGPAAVWREGEATASVSGADRYGLEPAPTLVIWTAPPGPAELRAALSRVRPERVALFGAGPVAAEMEPFLRRLAGLAKYAQAHREGRAEISALAAALAAREGAVRLGLAWLAARGDITLAWGEAGEALIAPGDGVAQANLDEIAARLSAALAETAAYRAHFRRAPAQKLLPEREGRSVKG